MSSLKSTAFFLFALLLCFNLITSAHLRKNNKCPNENKDEPITVSEGFSEPQSQEVHTTIVVEPQHNTGAAISNRGNWMPED